MHLELGGRPPSLNALQIPSAYLPAVFSLSLQGYSASAGTQAGESPL